MLYNAWNALLSKNDDSNGKNYTGHFQTDLRKSGNHKIQKYMIRIKFGVWKRKTGFENLSFS